MTIFAGSSLGHFFFFPNRQNIWHWHSKIIQTLFIFWLYAYQSLFYLPRLTKRSASNLQRGAHQSLPFRGQDKKVKWELRTCSAWKTSKLCEMMGFFVHTSTTWFSIFFLQCEARNVQKVAKRISKISVCFWADCTINIRNNTPKNSSMYRLQVTLVHNY